MANTSEWHSGSRDRIDKLARNFITRLRKMAAATANETRQEFTHEPKVPVDSSEDLQHVEVPREENKIEKMYLGIVAKRNEGGAIDIGLSAHDGTYNMDYAWHTLYVNEDAAKELSDFAIAKIRIYEAEQRYKFLGAGTDQDTVSICPYLTARMWAELDIVTMIFKSVSGSDSASPDYDLGVDETADSMARKCVREYGPKGQPMLSIGFLNEVDVDVAGKALMCTLDQYEKSVDVHTWEATLGYAQSLKQDKIRIAFFNSTPQGGGVALMRHALVRFSRLLGIRLQWYVPKPRPEVFRITKTNHNILQGVAEPDEYLSAEHAEEIREWTETNAKRFWLGKNGALRAVKDGGAHLVVVDDPQMPYLVKMAKDADPDRPVIFRSHIQVRGDLVDNDPEGHTAGVFKWLWQYAKLADLFVAHPVKSFVPAMVPKEKLAYLPATTDWLDGLNKNLSPQDTVFYMGEYNKQCHEDKQNPLDFPARDYIVQIARFDPAKGIDTVIRAYGEFRRKYFEGVNDKSAPQLVIAGHSAIDDPDATIIFHKMQKLIQKECGNYAHDISMMRLGPVDQTLNVLMSNARVALQLSTREGFEVKVSEAVHKGVPTIATNRGGIPLQVEHGKSGFIVEADDHMAVAEHMHALLTDKELWTRMSKYAASHVSDEVHTVGNALSWFYLADTLGKGEKLQGNGRWVNDLAREKAGVPYGENEPRLPRHLTTD